MKFFGIGLLLAIGITGLFWRSKGVNYKENHSVNYLVDTIARDLVVPWDIVFLPDGSMLFTERSGKVTLYRDEKLVAKPVLELAGLDLTKKMGLLGICIHPNYRENKWVYVAYNYRNDNNAFLRIVRYRFLGDTMVEPVILLDHIPASPNHTGCRLRFGPDKKLYVTTGDADRPVLAQDLKSLNGKILRINDDGSIPSDNPFVTNDTARKEIWTYGHRNTQGIDFDPATAQLYNSEHGPTGGDEINIIQKGNNYGWPVIHHQEIKAGMKSPLIEYTPSIGPSQITFYNGNKFPSLKGKLLIACLRGEKIMTLKPGKSKDVEEDNLLQSGYGRIRALTVGPDGYIYFSTSQNDPPEGKPVAGYDMLLRLRPSGSPTVMIKEKELSKLKNNSVNERQSAIIKTYVQLCAGCHGENMEGTERAKSMVDGRLDTETRSNIIKSIRDGVIEKGMPAWQGTLTRKEIEQQADYILKKVKRNKRIAGLNK